ncbi:death effector domain-containing protein-like [Haliotis cracherodii]|uniref:death effector domain-containing protein-like n=1 Tax=Haliotis rufescens TaxID=6454 RepID=UPI001EB0300B|nr:death effector domain-containing protein-like [Haliotis rufescens]
MASIVSDGKNLVGDALALHEMFRIIGDQLTPDDIKALTFIYGGLYHANDFFLQAKDGYSFLLSLERLGRIDESNFKHILELLRILTRQDLVQHLTLRRRKTVEPDPVDEYLEDSTSRLPTSRKRVGCASCLSVSRHTDQPDAAGAAKRRRRRNSARKCERVEPPCASPQEVEQRQGGEEEEEEIKKKVTCDIRLRVRAEYCQHENALDGNVFSNKPELIERQFEKFAQANTILKSRDLGSIICDIKFSELTYLDAFWRDYINGSLLEALKGVFITESLKQAVGHEAIKLLVNVDEDDYEAGRLKLLQNLSE